MRLLLVNSIRFANALRESGHEVITAGSGQHFDLHLAMKKFSIPEIIKNMENKPDAIIIELFGYRPFAADLSSTEIPIIAYVIDSYLNRYWIEYYGHLFDKILVDHLPDVEIYRKKGIDAYWFPLSVDEKLLPEFQFPRKLDYDITFVGRFSASRGKRQAIVNILKKNFNIHISGGDGQDFLPPEKMYKLFAKSRIVLNENLFNGWTMRIFEGAGSGSFVFSEEVADNNGKIFIDQQHLGFYKPENILEKAEYYLNNEIEREEIAMRARQEVLDKHTHSHRVSELIEHIRNIDIKKRFKKTPDFLISMEVQAYRLIMLRWPKTVETLIRRTESLALSLIKKDIKVPEMKLLLGQIYGQWTKDVAKSLKVLSEALKDNPDNLETRLALYEMLSRTGSNKIAAKIIEPLLNERMHRDLLINKKNFVNHIIGDFLQEHCRSYNIGFAPGVEDMFPQTAIQYYHRAAEIGDEEAWWKTCELAAEYGDYSKAYETGFALMRRYALSENRIEQVIDWAFKSYRFAEAKELSAKL